MSAEFRNSIAGFRDLTIVVAGDVMLDHYIHGATERTSPEAPVPVVRVERESFLAGGAANVARNVAVAGAHVKCLGLTGDDVAGRNLRRVLADGGVDVSGVLEDEHSSTTIKSRIVSQGQQIVRLDYEARRSSESTTLSDAQQRLLDLLAGAADTAHAIIISDYGKGLISTPFAQRAVAIAAAAGKPVFVDPKGRDYSRYRGAYAITPNSREAGEATGIVVDDMAGLRAAADAIKRLVECDLMVITRGADGLALLEKTDEWVLVPTSAREVFDVTGAGDTFVAWLALGVASGLSQVDAARLANTAAGVAVGKSGPATVSPLEFHRALTQDRFRRKILAEADLKELGEQLRQSGKRIVLTNGCFDFLHAGHLDFLQRARALGDALVLAINSDDSIRRLKGSPRPLISQHQREALLSSMEAVDFVVVFHDDTPHRIIEVLKPDFLVKGSNYTQEEVEGSEVVERLGGQVRLLPMTYNFSTSDIVTRLG